MAIQSVTTKIISTLGNKESLIPIIAKDAVDSASLTYNAYKAGGTVEGIDRAFDEFGTQAIWIGGIPFFKKLYDLSAYKLGKLNPDVDIRVLNNKEYASWASENAKGFINKKGKTVSDVANGAGNGTVSVFTKKRGGAAPFSMLSMVWMFARIVIRARSARARPAARSGRRHRVPFCRLPAASCPAPRR